MFVQYVTWEEFKKIIANNKRLNASGEFEEIIYRGHSSSEWCLETTLARYYKKQAIESDYYINSIRDVITRLENKELLNIFPSENPFLSGLGMGLPNSQHSKDLVSCILTMIWLRHHGFPCPILDWTQNAHVASWFAFGKESIDIKEVAVYCLKKPKLLFSAEMLQPNLSPKIELLMHNAINITLEDIKASHPDLNIFSDLLKRHQKQESSYSIILYKNGDKYYFNLQPPEQFENKNYQMEKYIILDSKEKQREILCELKEEYSMSYKNLYGHAHPDENASMKDFAIQHFIINE